MGWPQARQELERAIQRHGRDQRDRALSELAEVDPRLVRFVERVRWSTLCEQPLRFVEQRYSQLWSDITQEALMRQESRHEHHHQRSAHGCRNGSSAQPRSRTVRAGIGAPHQLLPTMLLDVGLSESDFYRDKHGLVFAAMRALHQASEPIDHLTVADQLERQGQLDAVGGRAAVEQFVGWVPAAGHGVHYARIVRQLSQLRRLLTATYQIQADVYERNDDPDHLLDRAEQLIFRAPRRSPAGHRADAR